MRKLVIRTVIITFCSALIAVVLGVFLFGIISPGKMSDITYDFGMEKIATEYADKAYKKTGKTEYLARAFDISVERKNDSDILSYGALLMTKDDFSEFAVITRDASYIQTVYGNFAKSYYHKGLGNAISLAIECLGNRFYTVNAVKMLGYDFLDRNDNENVQDLIINLATWHLDKNLTESEENGYQTFVSYLQSKIN